MSVFGHVNDVNNNKIVFMGHTVFFYISDYTSQILYDKSRHFGTNLGAFFSAMTNKQTKTGV